MRAWRAPCQTPASKVAFCVIQWQGEPAGATCSCWGSSHPPPPNREALADAGQMPLHCSTAPCHRGFISAHQGQTGAQLGKRHDTAKRFDVLARTSTEDPVTLVAAFAESPPASQAGELYPRR